MEERSAELLSHFVGGGGLTTEELAHLRTHLKRADIERLATSDLGRSGVSRKLFKLANVLFAIRAQRNLKRPAAPQAPGMFAKVRRAKPGQGGSKVASGGGANGTGKRS